jgi:hypothetical protein
MNCTYTTYSGGGSCIQNSSYESCNTQSCSLPNCNSGSSCGSCSATCGGGTQSCTYTTYSGGGACTQTSFSQSCNTQACTGGTHTCITQCGSSVADSVPITDACSNHYTGSFQWSCTSSPCPPSTVCGDNVCNGSESCSTCPSDCGTCSTLNTIWVTVFNDLDGNGSQNSGENGVSGVRIDICSGSVSSCTSSTASWNGYLTTNGSGQLIWQALGSATETFSVVPPTGYDVTTAPVVAASIPPDKAIAFGLKASPPPPISSLGNIFVTSNTYNPNLGGLTGADAKCQASADSNNLGGIWKAWLSDNTTSAASRLIHSTSPYYRMDGILVANNWTDLTDGNLAVPIIRTELNTLAPTNSLIFGISSVMTDTNPDGSIKMAGQNCNNWTVASAGYAFYGGNANRSDSFWTYYFGGICDPAAVGNHSLYCIKQGNATYDITTNVYVDLNGNGFQDTGESGYTGGATVTLSTGATGTTDANGNYSFTSLNTGTYTAQVTVPANYVATTTNPRTVTVGPSQTVNFGISPIPPNCTGLTANPMTVYPGGTSTLTTSGCPPGVDYTYYADPNIPGDTVTNTNTATSTWTSPAPYWQNSYAFPSVSVCVPLTSVCSNYSVPVPGIHIIPLFGISGNVYVDANKNGVKDGGESNYTASTLNISACSDASCSNVIANIQTQTDGTFSSGINLPQGQYYVSLQTLPTGYQATAPIPPAFMVTLGPNCSSNPPPSPLACDSNGNISVANYGITNSFPWIQTVSGDITGSNITNPSGGALDNPIPSSAIPACGGPYVSIAGSGGTPGIIYLGNSTLSSSDLGQGQGSPYQNGLNPPWNWIIQQDLYTQRTAQIKTSYTYVDSLIKQSGLPKTDITTVSGCSNLLNCQLPSNLANGIYIANGTLNLTGPSYTFPTGKNFVILVNGDLNIKTQIHVPKNPGSTVLFTASQDINVDSSVGTSDITSSTTQVEGYYSADRNFNALGGNTCPTSDLRLNIGGSVVVNASLNGGSFNNQRDLCAGNLQCPVFQIQERPDFILNAADLFKVQRRVWQEIAP